MAMERSLCRSHRIVVRTFLADKYYCWILSYLFALLAGAGILLPLF